MPYYQVTMKTRTDAKIRAPSKEAAVESFQIGLQIYEGATIEEFEPQYEVIEIDAETLQVRG